MLDPMRTVADLVLDHSECAEVFHRHRIDFCCRGDVTVDAAARAKGISPEALTSELARAIESRRVRGSDPRELSTEALIAHIVSKHHEYTRSVLPFVHSLAAKVARVHGDNAPKLRALASEVAELARALLPHLEEEEKVLFPALTARPVEAGRVRALLDAMESEHHHVGETLERIRAASDDFALPEWACNSYRTLFAELERLERDVHVHVHLENHVLEPRFAEAVER